MLEDVPYLFCLYLVYVELTISVVVAQRYDSTHPHSLLLGGNDFVPNPLSRHFPFKLSKGKKDIKRKPPHGGRCIELLGDGDEADAFTIERLDDLGEVGEGVGQPVYFIDDDGVDLSCCYIFE